jgi:hypothetical protein
VATGEEFTRVVLEIPVERISFVAAARTVRRRNRSFAETSVGLLQFANRLHKLDFDNGQVSNGNGNKSKNQPTIIPETFVDDLKRNGFFRMQTPASLFLKTTAADYFARAAALSKELSTDEIEVINAYSFKTNPDER